MKFAALALTLLLAVGSHADEWPILKGALPHVREGADRVVNALRGTEYEPQINEINARVTAYLDLITGVLESDDATRGYITAKTLVDQTITGWQESDLRKTLVARYNDYKTVFENFYNENEQAFDSLRGKIAQTIRENHEETGRVLKEALGKVREQVEGHVQSLRAHTAGQAEEYAEYIKKVYDTVSTGNFRETIAPNVEVIRQQLEVVYNAFISAINQQ